MMFRHVARWPLRTGMTVIGIALSGGILVASMFFTDTVNHVINVVFFQAERQTLTMTFTEPRSANIEEEVRHLPGVLATQPVRVVSVRLVHGQYSKRTVITGMATHANLSRLLDTALKPIDPPPGGLAVSTHMARELHLALGDTVTVEVMQERRPTVDLQVTEIVEQYMGFSGYMNLEALNRLMREGPTVTGIYALADKSQLDALYKAIKNTPATAGVALRDATLIGFRTTMESTMYVMIGILVSFAVLIAFGVSYSSARIALSERSRALASLRVIGFTRAEVAYILLGELAIVTLVALPLGCLLGFGLAWLMSPMLTTSMYSFPMIISKSTFGLAVIVVVLSAIACGFLIRRRVYNLDLIGVLKTRE